MIKVLGYKDKKPKIQPNVFLADGVKIIGDVEINHKSNVWFNSVIRADVNFVKIGKKCNIQDGSVIHVSSYGFSAKGKKGSPTVIADNVTIGHNATIHACEINSNTLIGMGAIILDKAIVKEMSFVAAGCLIPPGVIVPSQELWAGNPGRCIRKLKDKEAELILNTPETYYKLSQEFLKNK